MLIPHQYKGQLFYQADGEVHLSNGAVIPKGYCNATQMCQANNKRLDNYFRRKGTEAFIEATSPVTSLPRERLIIISQGGNNKEEVSSEQ